MFTIFADCSRKKFSLAQLPLSIGSAALTAPNFGHLALFSARFKSFRVHQLAHFSVSFDAGTRWGGPHRWTTKRWGTTDTDMSYSRGMGMDDSGLLKE